MLSNNINLFDCCFHTKQWDYARVQTLQASSNVFQESKYLAQIPDWLHDISLKLFNKNQTKNITNFRNYCW